jgi:hypothetical protein
MKYQILKNRVIELRKPILMVITSWFVVFLFFTIIPYLYINLALGILSTGITLHYIRTYKEKKGSTILMLSLLTVLLFGSFISIFVSYNQSATTLMVYEDGVEFSENAHYFGGKIWYFDHNLQGDQGQIDLTTILKIPSKTSIYHYTPNRPSGFEYFIEVKTVLKLANDEMTLRMWGMNQLEPDNPDKSLIFEEIIVVNDGYFDLGGYIYGGNITVDGTMEYNYYLFHLEASLDQEQEVESSLATSFLKIEGSETIEGDEWGYTESGSLSQKEIFDISLNEMEAIVVIGIAIFVSFLIIFLMLLVTGALDKVKYYLIIVTMASILILFIMLAISPNFPVVKELLDICQTIPDPFGVFVAIGNIVKIIAFVVAFVMWNYTIGNYVILCWGLWYVWTEYIGDFIGDVLESVSFKED